mmetsp:Transcript_100266/g.189074  ORF Transcript_100266/g.189074 Transcript_100266/m.189074 type:complete len:322 (+) Transcript_100266:134-1099(+)
MTVLVLWALLVTACRLICVVAEDIAQYEQCKDPLFETHWSGKDDIQTLEKYPVLKTNLALCPAYNDRTSCCHQTFESEQMKYYLFWRSALSGMILRADEHREAFVSAGKAAIAAGISDTDRGQYEAAIALYAQVLSPAAQKECFSSVLTYVAGMMCFACKPEWSQYTLMSNGDDPLGGVLAMRMASSVCVDLWAACASFGKLVGLLQNALRDSAVARVATESQENLDMFLTQQQLCDWAHDEIALHPFKLPSKEDQDIPLKIAKARRRLLGVPEKAFDVMQEGKDSTFVRKWQGIRGLTSRAELWLINRMLLIACATSAAA